MEELAKRMMPLYLLYMVESYFGNRKHTIPVYNDVLQGLVLGTLLWNVMYDGVLRFPIPYWVSITGFVEDITVVAEALTKDYIELTVNVTVKRIHDWKEKRGIDTCRLLSKQHITEVSKKALGLTGLFKS